MIQPSRNIKPSKELELDDLTQEIDAPLEDYSRPRDEPTLAKLDFEDLEIDL